MLSGVQEVRYLTPRLYETERGAGTVFHREQDISISPVEAGHPSASGGEL